MKSALIQKYYILKMARINSKEGLDRSLLPLDMMRIDTILFQRYGYDITITRKN
jgi:hypothetical protein